MAAIANKFISPKAPISRTAVATTADVAFNNPVNVVELLAPADNVDGVRFTSVYAITRATLAANLNCMLYTKVGTVYVLIDSELLGTVTPSATVKNGKVTYNYSEDLPLILDPGVGLAVSIGTAIANGVTFFASGGKY